MDLTRDRVADVLAEAAEAEKSELDKKEDEGEKKEEDESEKPSATPKLKAKAKAKAKAPSLKRPAASKVKPVKKQKPDEENNMFANFNPMFGGGGSLISDVNMGQSSSQRSGFLILFLLIFSFIYQAKKNAFSTGLLALELPSASAPASSATPGGVNLQIFGSGNGTQQLNNAAALKVLEALEWLGTAKESCTLNQVFFLCAFSAFFALFFHSHFFNFQGIFISQIFTVLSRQESSTERCIRLRSNAVEEFFEEQTDCFAGSAAST